MVLETTILPLNYNRKNWDSWIRTNAEGFKDLCLTAWLYPIKLNSFNDSFDTTINLHCLHCLQLGFSIDPLERFCKPTHKPLALKSARFSTQSARCQRISILFNDEYRHLFSLRCVDEYHRGPSPGRLLKGGLNQNCSHCSHYTFGEWTSQDSNLQPPGYEPGALTNWAKGPKSLPATSLKTIIGNHSDYCRMHRHRAN